MAVITNVGQIFGGQRAPSVRPRPQRDVITKAQQAQLDLSKEQMAAQRQSERERLAVTSIFQALGLIERGVIAGVQLGQDPAPVRAEEARAERLQDTLKQLREQEAASRVTTETPAAAPAPAAAPPTPQPAAAAPPGPAAPPRQTIDMTSGDWEQLVKGWPRFVKGMEDEATMRKTVNELEGKGFSGSDFKGGMKQLAFLIDNQEELQRAGVLNITEGEPSGYWGRLMGTAEGTPGWKAGYRAAREARTEGAPIFPLFEQIQAIRNTDPTSAEGVITKVLQNPPLLEIAIDEAKEITGSDPEVFDFTAAQAALERGEHDAAIRLVTPVLAAGPEAFKGRIKGLDKAHAIFGKPGEEFQYPEPRTYSIRALKSAWAAMDEAGDPRAATLLEDRVILGAIDIESIPGIETAGGPRVVLGRLKAHITGGEPEREGGARQRAMELYQLAAGERKASLEERKVKIGEHEATSKRMRAGKLRSRREYGAASASARATESLEEVREWPEYQIVLEARGQAQAEKGAKWAASRGSSVSKSTWLRKEAEGIIAKREAEAKKTADAAAAKEEGAALKVAIADKVQTGRQKAEDRVGKKQAALDELLDEHGLGEGDTLTTRAWVDGKMANVTDPSVEVETRERLEKVAQTRVTAINKRIKKATLAVKAAETALKGYLTRHRLE